MLFRNGELQVMDTQDDSGFKDLIHRHHHIPNRVADEEQMGKFDGPNEAGVELWVFRDRTKMQKKKRLNELFSVFL